MYEILHMFVKYNIGYCVTKDLKFEFGSTKVIITLFLNAAQKVPPNFDVPLKPVTVTDGEKLTLSCHVRGSPPFKIQWLKDRRELSSSPSTKITFVDGTATLEMVSVSKTDAGDYLCKATNDAGSEFCKCKVTIKGIILFMSCAMIFFVNILYFLCFI